MPHPGAPIWPIPDPTGVYIRHPVSPIDLLLTLERLSDEVEANRVTARSPEPRAAA